MKLLPGISILMKKIRKIITRNKMMNIFHILLKTLNLKYLKIMIENLVSRIYKQRYLLFYLAGSEKVLSRNKLSIKDKNICTTFEILERNLIRNSHQSSKSEKGDSEKEDPNDFYSDRNIFKINGNTVFINTDWNHPYYLELKPGEENFGIDGDEFNNEEKKLYNQIENQQKFSDVSSNSIANIFDSRKIDNYHKKRRNFDSIAPEGNYLNIIKLYKYICIGTKYPQRYIIDPRTNMAYSV
mgnify:CR=1 FL=1